MQEKSTNIFQVGLMMGAALFGMLGFLMFADIIPSPWGSKAKQNYGTVTVWGTVDERVVTSAFNEAFPGIETVRMAYVQKDPDTLDADLTEALASNRAPDAVIFTHDGMYRHRDRLVPFSMALRDLKNTFIEEVELLVYPQGMIGMPIAVDPLVMYWNRDLFSAEGIANPPQSWTEFYVEPMVQLTKRGTTQGAIAQSGIALGQSENVLHAKEILATLILQTGNAITMFEGAEAAQTLKSVIARDVQSASSPAIAALRFYTRFADPTRGEYSWSRALPVSRDFFAQGDLATYFGFASEYAVITQKNPHLNFDMAPLPQAKVKTEDPGRSATFGTLYAAGVLKAGANPSGGSYIAGLFGSREFSQAFSDALGIAPVRRDMLSVEQNDPFKEVVYRGALIARGFVDPDTASTKSAFQSAIEDVLSARRDAKDSITVLDGRLSESIKRSMP